VILSAPPIPAAKDTRKNQEPERQIVLAVAPREAAALSEAVALGIELTAVARSGRPGDTDPGEIPSADRSADRVEAIETIIGSRRETVLIGPKAVSGSF
jgi:hypothetical protein